MNNRPEDIDAYNQSSLEDLAWAIEAGQGEFSLLLACCNYVELRDRLAQQLQSICQVQITELRLDPSDTTLYTKIRAQVKQEKPEALMVMGLESVKNIDELLRATNQVREEFRKHFHFPLLLWIDDRIQTKLTQLAFDFKDWGTTVKLAIPVNLLISELQKRVDSLFEITLESSFDSFLSNEIILGDNYGLELEAGLEDLTTLGQELPSDLQAGCDFIRGRAEYTNGNFSKALEHYNKSLAFWQQKRNDSQEENYRLREADLQFHIGLCYSRQAERENQTKIIWQKAKQSFQQCLAIFDRAGRPDLVAKFINCLAEVLAILEDYEQLDKLAQKAIKLHQKQKYDNRVDLAKDYGFIALVSLKLKQPRYEYAAENANLALEKIKTVPLVKQKYKSLYVLLLAQAQEYLGQHLEAVENQEEAAAIEDKGNNNLYLSFLAELQALYCKNKHYLEAYQAKQEQIAIKQQSGLIAFVGANRLKKNLSSKIDGRKIDVDALVKRIAENRYKTTIIYGQSGVGKSSLLEAELISTLQHKKRVGLRDLLVVYQRVYSNWEQELAKGLKEELEEWQERGEKCESGEKGKNADTSKKTEREQEKEDFFQQNPILGEIFAQLKQNDEQRNLLTVLIFDQFEEFFFFSQTLQERQRFFQFFARCLSLPFVKIILSLREDYLHLILQGTRGVDLSNINNDILDKDILYYVGNFSPQEATKVINQLTASSPFSLKSDLIKRLVEDLKNEFEEIRPIELQVVGAQLQAENIRTLEAYEKLGDKPKDQLVQKYLEEVVDDCGKENKQVAELVLYLLTDENNNRPLKTRSELEKDLEKLGKNLRETKKKLDLVLNIFVLSRLVFLLREILTDHYQLVHDYLVCFIRKQQGSSILEQISLAKEKEELFRNSLINSLSRSSLSLFAANQELDALLEGLRAGQQWKQEPEKVTPEPQRRLAEALHQAVYGGRECNRLAGHNSSINSIAFSPNGKTIAIASEDGMVKLWQLESKELQTFKGHSSSIDSVAFSPDGQTIVSGSGDKTVKLWNLEGQELQTFEGHSSSINSVTFSPDGQNIASGSRDKTVKLWNLEGQELQTFEGHSSSINSVAFSPDGQTIASGSGDNTVKLWNLEGQELSPRESELGSGKQVVIFALSLLIQSGLHRLASLLLQDYPEVQDFWGRALLLKVLKTVHKFLKRLGVKKFPDWLWNLEGKKRLTFNGHSDEVSSVAFSPDGQTIASASQDGTVKLWDLEGKELRTFKGDNSPVSSIAFSPDGQTIASASQDGTVKLWNLEGKELRTFKGDNSPVSSVAFSPDWQTIASGSRDRTVKVYNLAEEKLLSLTGHKDWVNSVAFSPDSQTIASGSRDGTVKLWNLKGKELLTFKGDNSQTISYGSWDRTVKVVYNLALAEEKLLSFTENKDWVNSVAFSPDSQTIASGSRDGTVKLWNLAGGQELLTLTGHKDWVNSVAFSPDGQTIASASQDGTVKLWDFNGKKLLTFKGHNSKVNSVAFSPDGQTIASASHDKTVKLWDKKGKELLTFNGHNNWVNSVAFSPDGQTIASGSRDKTVKLWNLAGQELLTLTGHKDWVNSVAFSPDGKTLASASYDKTVKLWDLNGKKLLSLTEHKDGVNSVAFSPDGKTLASASRDKTVILGNFAIDDLLVRGCKRVGNYLKYNPRVNQSDKLLCEGISQQKEEQ